MLHFPERLTILIRKGVSFSIIKFIFFIELIGGGEILYIAILKIKFVVISNKHDVL